MSDAPVRIEYRSVALGEHVLQPATDDRVFVAFDHPPPVRTVLRVIGSDGERTLEVVHVIETPDADERGVPGIYGRLSAGASALKVGSEHLEGVQATAESMSSDTDGNAAVAMPAPVLFEESDAIEIDDVPPDYGASSDDSGEGAATESDGAGEDEAAESGSEPANGSTSTDNDSGEARTGGRRRGGRGRKRK